MSMKKRSKKLLFILAFILIVLIVGIVWYQIPTKLLRGNSSTIAEIYLFDGDTGREMIVSDPDAVSFIVGELQDVCFKRDGLALGFGTSYHLQFITDTGRTKAQFIIQTSRQVKKGILFYTLSDESENLKALRVYLEKLLDWSLTDTGTIPAPPQDEDFQIPDLPVGDELKELYPFDTNQITFYLDTSDSDTGEIYLTYNLLDQTEIDEVLENLSYSKLNLIAPANQSDCEPYLFIDFHNDTVLACSENPTYIWFGDQLTIETDENGNIISCALSGDYIGPYVVGDEELSIYLSSWATKILTPELWDRIYGD
jgi:hypothetical protein